MINEYFCSAKTTGPFLSTMATAILPFTFLCNAFSQVSGASGVCLMTWKIRSPLDIVLFIRPVEANMSSKLIYRSHHQLLFIGDWYAFHDLRKKYSQQFVCMP